MAPITWSPAAAGTAAYNKIYTAKMNLDSSKTSSLKFYFADNCTVSVNGGKVNGTLAQNSSGAAIYVTFPKTDPVKLLSITPPSDISVANGTGTSSFGLPSTVKISVADKSVTDALVTWQFDSGSFKSSETEAQSITYKGTVTKPDTVTDPDKVIDNTPIYLTVYVGAAAQAATPMASPDSGSYTGAQTVSLSSDTNGAEIYYSTDSSTPSTPYTAPIAVSSGTTIKAVATKSGLRNSMVMSYVYTITQPSSGGGSASSCTLTFNTNGGSTIASVSKDSGTTVDLSAYQPTKDGCTFAGWYADAALTEAVTSVKLAVSTTVYAKWTEGSTTTLPFVDVPKDSWYHDAVAYVWENSLFAGTSDTTFSPGTAMNRAMLVTVLWRQAGKPAAKKSAAFKDVASGAYYADAVAWANENKIVTGYSKTAFGPKDTVTREQMAAILYRYAKYKGYDVSVGEDTNILSYADAQEISEYAIPAIQWACGAELIQGSKNKLMPKNGATRAQVAAILMRFCKNVVK